MIDTGSQASIISAYFLSKIPAVELKNEQTDQHVFRSACGMPMETIGTFEIDVKIHSHDGSKIRQLFHAIPNLTEACILGIDFITNNSVRIDSVSRRISYVSDQNRYHIIGKIDRVGMNNATPSVIKETKQQINIEDSDSPENRKLIEDLIKENRDIVAEKMTELGKSRRVQHEIKTGTNPPIFTPPRRTARATQHIIQENVEEMLLHNIIRPSVSPYSSPVVLVPKKSGERRFCIDYRKLNSITEKNKYPLPRIEDTKDNLHGAKFFSTIDLYSGYWQIEIQENDKQKTAFTTDDGHFEFNRMPFGLTNAPATFQKLMNDILRPIKKQFALVYLDDVIIFSKTIEDHIKHIKYVFQLLRQEGLKIKLEKCAFLQKEVEYLGHIVTEDGIKPDPKKQQAIHNYPTPKNVDQVRSFLGLAGYYRKFVKNYADKAHSLTKLTSKNVEWQWGPEQEKAFQLLKDCLTSPPILGYPDFSRDFIIHTDASGYGVGSVLAQMQGVPGKEREVVISYTSQHLNKTQTNWSTIEKEAYAIVHAVKIFYSYLYGRKFQVLTDHRSLQWLMSIKEPTGKLARWALRLQEFDIDISYRPGKANQNADCLSRIPIPDEGNQTSPEETAPIIFLMTKDFLAEQAKDKYCASARRKFSLALDRLSSTENGAPETETNKIQSRSRQPSPYRSTGDPDSSTEIDSEDDDEDERFKFIELHNGLMGTPSGQILVPEPLRIKILQRFHDSPYAGHLGSQKTAARIRRRYLWPNMTKMIRDYVKKCAICAKRKAVAGNKAPMKSMPPPEHVWQTMAMDIVGPVVESAAGNCYFLVMGEYFTRYTITAPMPNQTKETIAKTFIKSIILQHGVPERVLTDQGPNFLSELMDELYKQLGIERLRTTAYRPCCDGMVERFNRTVADMIASYVVNQPDRWDEYLPYATFAYNTAVHSSTGYTPFYLMFGREAREPNDVLPPTRLLIISDENTIFSQMWHEAKETAKNNLAEAKEKQKYYYDKNKKLIEYKVGDHVLLKEMANVPGKFNMRYLGPYRVLEKKGDVTYKLLELETKTEYVTHIDRLKPFSINDPKTEHENGTQNKDGESTQLVDKAETQVEAEKETVNFKPPTADEPFKKKRARSPKRRSKSLDRPPQQTRYELRRSIKLPAKLKD